MAKQAAGNQAAKNLRYGTLEADLPVLSKLARDARTEIQGIKGECR